MAKPKEAYLALAKSPEDEVFLRRLLDHIDQALKHKRVESTDFINPFQAKLAEGIMRAYRDLGFQARSGATWAERSIYLLAPDFMPMDELEGVCVLKGPWDTSFNHKDVLGALMGLGISRKKVGDIFFQNGEFFFAIKEELASFVLLDLKQVGRKKLDLQQVRQVPVIRKKPDYKEQVITASSDRLDGIISEAYGLSRSKASDQIKKGLVKVNFCVEEKISTSLKAGDLVSVRKKGRFIFDEIIGESKKGRKRIRLLFLI